MYAFLLLLSVLHHSVRYLTAIILPRRPYGSHHYFAPKAIPSFHLHVECHDDEEEYKEEAWGAGGKEEDWDACIEEK